MVLLFSVFLPKYLCELTHIATFIWSLISLVFVLQEEEEEKEAEKLAQRKDTEADDSPTHEGLEPPGGKEFTLASQARGKR